MRCTFEGMLFVLLLCSHSPAGPAYSPEVTSFICYQAPLQLLQNVVANNGAGAGGYGVFAEPDNRISFAYTPNRYTSGYGLGNAFNTLVDATYECL